MHRIGADQLAMASREQFKLVILGDSGVGKTNLMMRFTMVGALEKSLLIHQNTFSYDSETTIGAAFQVHRDETSDTTLQIWDTAGQERFAQLVPLYYHGAHGAVLVYDITNRSSFDRAKKWKIELEKYGEVNVVIALVGNKADLASSRAVSMAEAQAYASEQNCLFFETSALTNNPPVATIFTKLTAGMRKYKKNLVLPPPPLLPKQKIPEDDGQKCCIIS